MEVECPPDRILARGHAEFIAARRWEISGLFVDTVEASYMNDQALFQDGNVIVTSSILVHGNNHYPLSSIKSVVFFKEPLDVKGLLINAAVALAGLYGISTFSSVGVIVGLIALGICGFNLYGGYNDITNPTYIVAVDFHNGDSIYIKKRNLAWAQKLHDTLLTAMRS